MRATSRSQAFPHPSPARLVVCVLLCAAAGCGGPSNTAVTGKVVYKEDGQPLTRGMVVFQLVSDPKVQASADVNPDGTFTLGSSTGPGAIPGEYEVQIQHPYLEEHERNKRLFPPRFERFATSGLRYTVRSGGNDFKIEIEKAARR